MSCYFSSQWPRDKLDRRVGLTCSNRGIHCHTPGGPLRFGCGYLKVGPAVEAVPETVQKALRFGVKGTSRPFYGENRRITSATRGVYLYQKWICSTSSRRPHQENVRRNSPGMNESSFSPANPNKEAAQRHPCSVIRAEVSLIYLRAICVVF